MRSLVTAIGMLVLAAPLAAQATPPAGPPPKPPELRFEREVFDYDGGGRRDPFRALTSSTEGIQLSDLTITGILLDPLDPAGSLVTLKDKNKRNYRVRRGESIGNITVVTIERTRIVVSIEEFGMKRNEVLNIKSNTREGA